MAIVGYCAKPARCRQIRNGRRSRLGSPGMQQNSPIQSEMPSRASPNTLCIMKLRNLYVFNISFENGTPITEEEMENPWNAIGIRMLHQLLDKPIDYHISASDNRLIE
ncbi:hypothetical protein V8E54_008881 [Elaphomyces granulatus]